MTPKRNIRYIPENHMRLMWRALNYIYSVMINVQIWL